MPVVMKTEVTGMKAIFKKMSKLELRMQNKLLAPAVRKAAVLLVKDIRSRVRVRTGTLSRSIGVKKVSKARSVGVSFIVGPRVGKERQQRLTKGGRLVENSDGFYGRFLEVGTRSIPAKPFMRPAFDATGSSMINVTLQELKKRFKF